MSIPVSGYHCRKRVSRHPLSLKRHNGGIHLVICHLQLSCLWKYVSAYGLRRNVCGRLQFLMVAIHKFLSWPHFNFFIFLPCWYREINQHDNCSSKTCISLLGILKVKTKLADEQVEHLFYHTSVVCVGWRPGTPCRPDSTSAECQEISWQMNPERPSLEINCRDELHRLLTSSLEVKNTRGDLQQLQANNRWNQVSDGQTARGGMNL